MLFLQIFHSFSGHLRCFVAGPCYETESQLSFSLKPMFFQTGGEVTRTCVSKSFWNKCLKNALSLPENQHQHLRIKRRVYGCRCHVIWGISKLLWNPICICIIICIYTCLLYKVFFFLILSFLQFLLRIKRGVYGCCCHVIWGFENCCEFHVFLLSHRKLFPE